MERWQWDIRCCDCGRFCVPADSGTPYGSCQDLEPPETLFFCPRCAERHLNEAQTTPEKVNITWWRPPNYVDVAKSVLRHRRAN